MTAFDEAAFDQLCKELPWQIRRLRLRRDRDEARKLFGQSIVTLHRLGMSALPPLEQPEAAKAFAEASRIAGGNDSERVTYPMLTEEEKKP